MRIIIINRWMQMFFGHVEALWERIMSAMFLD